MQTHLPIYKIETHKTFKTNNRPTMQQFKIWRITTTTKESTTNYFNIKRMIIITWRTEYLTKCSTTKRLIKEFILVRSTIGIVCSSKNCKTNKHSQIVLTKNLIKQKYIYEEFIACNTMEMQRTSPKPKLLKWNCAGLILK